MKTKLLFILLSVFAVSCSDDKEHVLEKENEYIDIVFQKNVNQDSVYEVLDYFDLNFEMVDYKIGYYQHIYDLNIEIPHIYMDAAKEYLSNNLDVMYFIEVVYLNK